MRCCPSSALLAMLLIAATAASAANPDSAGPDEPSPSPAIPAPTQFVTEHSGSFNGIRVDYRVIAGETYLRDGEGEPTASIFTFAYLQRDVDPAARPVTFVWNGGPGSPSVWLHMGAYGPRRIVVPSDAQHAGPPPYEIAPAPQIILDVTDLVFVDPVGTGFSRALGEHEGREFWGMPEDPQSIADFIHTWITEHNRWNSPKFLLGESYGTTRAAAVAQILEEEMSVALNGILFVSQALDYQGSTPYVDDNLISFVTFVPTMAATALYHGRVHPQQPDLPTFVQAAREFATDEYLPALWKGNRLPAAEYAAVRARLASFTGISETYLDRVDLRLRADRFTKELLREQGLAVGHLDGRYVQDDIDDVATGSEGDAASKAISPAFKAAFMHYLRNDLHVDWQRAYLEPADPDLASQWDWNPTGEVGWEPRYVNTAHQLAAAMRTNPYLEVMVASGYYDLITPFFDAEYTLNRHDIPADRVQYEYYPGGHMMYVHEPSRTRLLEDSRRFIQRLTR